MYHGAFIETFVRDLADRFVTTTTLRGRYLTEVWVNRPLRLVDLRGPGLRQLGADARLITGSYQVAQRWALAVYQHPDQPDGILYRSRYDPAQECAVLFDRLRAELAVGPSICLADPQHAALLADILDTYQIEWLDA